MNGLIYLQDGYRAVRFWGPCCWAINAKSMLHIQDPNKRLLSCSVTFVGPVQQGSARLTIEVLREGKSVTTLEARLWQDDAVQTILVASFGASRASSIEVKQEPVAPAYVQPENLSVIPFGQHMPECFQHFEVCWAEGNYPVTASEHPDFGGWSRFSPEQHENRQLTLPDLIVLMDIGRQVYCQCLASCTCKFFNVAHYVCEPSPASIV